jgi:hypothetical protein
MTLPDTNTHIPSCRHSWFQVLVKPKPWAKKHYS